MLIGAQRARARASFYPKSVRVRHVVEETLYKCALVVLALACDRRETRPFLLNASLLFGSEDLSWKRAATFPKISDIHVDGFKCRRVCPRQREGIDFIARAASKIRWHSDTSVVVARGRIIERYLSTASPREEWR